MNLKNVFLSVGIFVFALGMFGLVSTSKAEAATCTAEASGLWSAATTWDAACNTGAIPLAGDSISIPGSFVVHVDVNTPVVGTITISNATAGGATGIIIDSTNTLSAASVSMAVPVAVGVSTIDVGTGTLDLTGNLTIMGGADGTRAAVVTTSTGTINVDGNVSFSGGSATQSKLVCTDACHINVGGNFGGGATLGGVVTPSTGTLTMNGGAAQVLSTGATGVYYNLVISNTSGGVTIPGQVGIGGALTITSGTLDTGVQQLDVTGTTTIQSGGTLLLSAVNANKTFSDVVINTGGTWTESAAAVPTFTGSLTNNGTFTANTGIHTFSGTGKVIAGTVSIPNLTISGTVSNTNTLTVSADLAGAGTLTNLATGILNIGGTSGITGLTTTAVGNTVNYNGAAQAVRAATYYNLILSGSGVKTAGGTLVITHTSATSGGALTINSGATLTLANSSSTTHKLLFGVETKPSGTWGAAASSATFKDASGLYFTSGVNQLITVSVGGTASTGTTITTNSSTTTTTTTTTTPSTTTTTVETTTTTPVVDTTPGCGGGNVFNTSTGKPCSNNTAVTSKKTYALGQVTLKNGSKGEAVKELQRFLNDKLSLGLVVDGKLGPKTIAVIKTWQKNNGLVADGLIGPKTKAMMNQ